MHKIFAVEQCAASESLGYAKQKRVDTRQQRTLIDRTRHLIHPGCKPVYRDLTFAVMPAQVQKVGRVDSDQEKWRLQLPACDKPDSHNNIPFVRKHVDCVS